MFTVCLPSTNIFCICFCPLPDGKRLPLVRQFQRAIICHQRTQIGEAIEVLPSQNEAVPGEIIVIFAKIENFQDGIYFFFAPRRAFLLISSYSRTRVAGDCFS